MSIKDCLSIIQLKFDQEQDNEGLIEELAQIEAESLENGKQEPYLLSLSSFLQRADELLAEEDLDEPLLIAAIANLRDDLEKLQASQVPDDPLEHLFLDMTRYEAGTIPASSTLSTLSRYESLVLAMRDTFEHTTDPSDESEVAEMMRNGLDILENAGKLLRQDLNNGLDHNFDNLRSEFQRGVDILWEFKGKVTFVKRD